MFVLIDEIPDNLYIENKPSCMAETPYQISSNENPR